MFNVEHLVNLTVQNTHINFPGRPGARFTNVKISPKSNLQPKCGLTMGSNFYKLC